MFVCRAGCPAARTERSSCAAPAGERHTGRCRMAGVSRRAGCRRARRVAAGRPERGAGRTSACRRPGRVAAPPESGCRGHLRRNRVVPGGLSGLAGPRNAYPARRGIDAGELSGPGCARLVRPVPAAGRPRQAAPRGGSDRGRGKRKPASGCCARPGSTAIFPRTSSGVSWRGTARRSAPKTMTAGSTGCSGMSAPGPRGASSALPAGRSAGWGRRGSG